MNKMPFFLKALLGGIPILLVIVYILTMVNGGIKNRKQFYTQHFSSIIVSSNTFQGRSTEFHLANGLKLYFGLGVLNSVMVGDSIKKEANTYTYYVYRKNISGEYNFFTSFNSDKNL